MGAVSLGQYVTKPDSVFKELCMFRRIQYYIFSVALLGMSACEKDRNPFNVPQQVPENGFTLSSGRGGFGMFAWDTPIAVDGSTFKRVQDIKAGDAVYACDTTLQWHRETLEWAYGLGPAEIGPHTMIWVVYNLGGKAASLVVSSDIVFLLSNGKTKKAIRLIPGEKLKGADGNPAEVKTLMVGLSKNGAQTDPPVYDSHGGRRRVVAIHRPQTGSPEPLFWGARADGMRIKSSLTLAGVPCSFYNGSRRGQ